jgi:hypothetical protein
MQRGAAGQNAPSRLSTRPPFGKFSVADRSARQGVHPRTHQRFVIAPSSVPRFSAGDPEKLSQARGSWSLSG